jgi:hypothetical protein
LPLWLAVFAIGALAAGCGGGGDDPGADGGGGGGTSWSISGTPPASIVAGTGFSFAPTVTNPDNVSLTFSIINLPSWATFNTSSGRITGTPSQNDVGTYSNIRLSVTDGTTTYTSSPYTIQVVGTASGTATLTWAPPTTYTNGQPLTVAGYKVYWGMTQGNYPNVVTLDNGGLASYVVDELTSGTWYFAVTSFDAARVESAYSNVAFKVIP